MIETSRDWDLSSDRRRRLLITIRKAHDLDRKDLAAILGIEELSLAHIEAGSRDAGLKHLVKLQHHFHYPTFADMVAHAKSLEAGIEDGLVATGGMSVGAESKGPKKWVSAIASDGAEQHLVPGKASQSR
jgi:DNA-binding XRE family transcriptional regulator